MILEQSAVTNLLAYDKPKVIQANNKNCVSLCASFAEILSSKLSEYFTLKEIPKITSTVDVVLCRCSIEINNSKYQDFTYTIDITQTTWDGVCISFRARDNNGVKNIGKNELFKTLRTHSKNSPYELGSGTWSVLSKSISHDGKFLNFRKLEGDTIANLTIHEKMDALASSVTEDSKKLYIHIKNITQADL